MVQRRQRERSLFEVLLPDGHKLWPDASFVAESRSKKPARRTYERQRWFRRGQRWRVGCERRISALKRRHGLRRCRYHADGTHRWVGLGVIANNLVSPATVLGARATA